jgi:hypothetical protein
MFIIILALLWLVRDLHKDAIDADNTLEKIRIESAHTDTLLRIKTNEVDSLIKVVDWYKKLEDDKKKKPKQIVVKIKKPKQETISTDTIK